MSAKWRSSREKIPLFEPFLPDPHALSIEGLDPAESLRRCPAQPSLELLFLGQDDRGSLVIDRLRQGVRKGREETETSMSKSG